MSKTLQILNLITDEKFVDSVIENHDVVVDDVKHFYVIIVAPNIKKEAFSFSYIENHHRIGLIFENEIIDFIKKNSINAIILHSLYSIPVNILPQINKSIPILWSAWGSDIYQRPYATPFIPLKNLYFPNTLNTLKEISKNEKGKIKFILGNIKKYLIRKHIYKPSIIKSDYSVLERINFFSGVLDLEYELMKQIKDFKAMKSIYVYGPLFYKLPSIRCNKNNILLGNSGNPTNNHIDILQVLKSRGINGIKIFSPLNYGGDQKYIDKVNSEGMKLYGESFQPLTMFLPISEYTDIIKSCGNIIIGSMRQQAMGNISMALAMGCKVYFYKDSLLYKYFKQNDIIIFTIDEDLSVESINIPLTENEVNHNRMVLQKIRRERWNPEELKRLYTQFREFKTNTSVTNI